MIFFLYAILGLLNLIELTTPVARLSGIRSGDLSSGLQLQSSMSIVSRVLNTFFMPILGYLSDINGFKLMDQNTFIICIMLLVGIMISFYIFKDCFFSLYTSICKSIIFKGSIFKFFTFYEHKTLKVKKNRLKNKFKPLRSMTVLAFVPLYISWPIVFFMIKEFPENRGFILGISSLINGINSLLLVLLIDPYLIKISKYKNLSSVLFTDQINLRFFSLFFAVLILFILSFFL